MEEYTEFRIPEKQAKNFLDPDEGTLLGGTVRKLRLNVRDPRYNQIGEIDRAFRDVGDRFFLGWEIRRKYTHAEIKQAELFQLDVTTIFEPPGELCGTVYDDTVACPVCGAGRKQISDLVLDLRRLPRKKHIACSIAGELVISQRLAELLVDTDMTGFELRPVQHKGYYTDTPISLKQVPTGREILRLAQEAGYIESSWDFFVWLNRPERSDLLKLARQEYVDVMTRRELQKIGNLPIWYQLVVTSTPVPVIPPTRFGVRPFGSGDEKMYECPYGHVSGLNLLSELWIPRCDWDSKDIGITQNNIGWQQGLLRPMPLLLISPRLWHLLKLEKIQGCRVSVVHCL